MPTAQVLWVMSVTFPQCLFIRQDCNDSSIHQRLSPAFTFMHFHSSPFIVWGFQTKRQRFSAIRRSPGANYLNRYPCYFTLALVMVEHALTMLIRFLGTPHYLTVLFDISLWMLWEVDKHCQKRLHCQHFSHICLIVHIWLVADSWLVHEVPTFYHFIAVLWTWLSYWCTSGSFNFSPSNHQRSFFYSTSNLLLTI